MKVQRGSYKFAVDEVGLTVQRSPRETHSGTPYLDEVTVSVEGKLRNKNGDPLALDSKIRDMERAFASPTGDFGLLHDNGSRTHSFWLNSETLGGIFTKMVSFPNYKNAEYVTYRTFQIQATFLLVTRAGIPGYTSFEETINISGGGPKYGVKEVNYGPGVVQQLRTHAKCTATQSGTARALFRDPIIPEPLWPEFLTQPGEITDRSPATRGSARFGNLAVVEIERSWSYTFESPFRLFGSPNFTLD